MIIIIASTPAYKRGWITLIGQRAVSNGVPSNSRPTLINPPRAEAHSQEVGFLLTPFWRIKILLLCFWAQTQEYFVGGCWLILWCGPKPNHRHWPREIGLPSSFLIPRFMGLGFTNSVQIRAGIDYTALVQSLERALTFIGLLEERRIWERVARPLRHYSLYWIHKEDFWVLLKSDECHLDHGIF